MRCDGMSWATLGNLGMVQALNVRCVHQTISRTTLLSTAYHVQKGARHLMAPHHMKTANVKLASSSQKMESGNLIEEKVWLRLDFCHDWCCFGDAQVIVSETGQGVLKEHRNGHHSNVCNNSKRTAVKNWLWDLHFGMRSCECPTHQALLHNSCVQCADLHLDCAAPGSTALTARPQQGFARLGNKTRAFECLPPQERCNASGQDHSSKVSKESGCAEGYIGVMCMDCAPNFYAAGSACKECQDYDLEFPNPWLFAPVIVIVIAVVALWLWRRRHTEPEVQQVRSNSCFSEFKEQIQAQGPILLQHCRWAMSTLSFCVFHFSDYFYIIFLLSWDCLHWFNLCFEIQLQGQLWGVLAALRKTTDASSSWEIPYIETLQFSLSSLKGALNLQCKFDAWPWNA